MSILKRLPRPGQPGKSVYPLLDVGELATRIAYGAITSIDRRGNWIWADGFENGLEGKWDTGTQGASSAVELSVFTIRDGAYSGLLYVHPITGDYAELIHLFPYPAAGNFGLEFAFAIPVVSPGIACWIKLYDGSNLFTPLVHYSPVAEELIYADVDGNSVVLASGLELYSSNRLFHHMKLVVDTIKKEYVRLIVNEVEHDLKGIAGEVTTDTSDPLLEIVVRADAESNDVGTAYIDNVILTQNEPPNG